MAMRGVGFCVFALALLSAIGCVSAEYTMTLYVTPPFFPLNGTFLIPFNLVNSGDAIGYIGTVEITYPPWLTSKNVVFNPIQPNVNYTGQVNVEVGPDVLPGLYPLIFSLQFYDSNSYPIYMVFESQFSVRKYSSSKVHGALSDVQFPSGKSGIMTLTVSNADDVPHTVKTRLLMPNSLKADKTDETIEIKPRTEKKIDYRISNFMAIPGSNLFVFSTIEYDDGKTHYSTIARGKVVIEEKVNTERPFFSVLSVIILAVLGVYSYFNYFKPKR